MSKPHYPLYLPHECLALNLLSLLLRKEENHSRGRMWVLK